MFLQQRTVPTEGLTEAPPTLPLPYRSPAGRSTDPSSTAMVRCNRQTTWIRLQEQSMVPEMFRQYLQGYPLTYRPGQGIKACRMPDLAAAIHAEPVATNIESCTKIISSRTRS
jgi:hypothetical protein